MPKRSIRYKLGVLLNIPASCLVKQPLYLPEIKLAYFLDDRYLSGEDSSFVEKVTEDLEQFAGEGNDTGRVLLFPPVNSYKRLLIHKTVEDFRDLTSFSVGEGEGRQTVVCFAHQLLTREVAEEEMSGQRPPAMRGRGRAKFRDQNSPSPTPPRLPYNVGHPDGHSSPNTWSGDRQGQSAGVGQIGNRSDPGARYDDGSPTSPSPGDDGVGARQQERQRKGDRSKNRRPDVQVYVPRARRAPVGRGRATVPHDQDISSPNRPVAPGRGTDNSPPRRGRIVPPGPDTCSPNRPVATRTETHRKVKQERELYVPKPRQQLQHDPGAQFGSRSQHSSEFTSERTSEHTPGRMSKHSSQHAFEHMPEHSSQHASEHLTAEKFMTMVEDAHSRTKAENNDRIPVSVTDTSNHDLETPVNKRIKVLDKRKPENESEVDMSANSKHNSQPELSMDSSSNVENEPDLTSRVTSSKIESSTHSYEDESSNDTRETRHPDDVAIEKASARADTTVTDTDSSEGVDKIDTADVDDITKEDEHSSEGLDRNATVDDTSEATEHMDEALARNTVDDDITEGEEHLSECLDRNNATSKTNNSDNAILTVSTDNDNSEIGETRSQSEGTCDNSVREAENDLTLEADENTETVDSISEDKAAENVPQNCASLDLIDTEHDVGSKSGIDETEDLEYAEEVSGNASMTKSPVGDLVIDADPETNDNAHETDTVSGTNCDKDEVACSVTQEGASNEISDDVCVDTEHLASKQESDDTSMNTEHLASKQDAEEDLVCEAMDTCSTDKSSTQQLTDESNPTDHKERDSVIQSEGIDSIADIEDELDEYSDSDQEACSNEISENSQSKHSHLDQSEKEGKNRNQSVKENNTPGQSVKVDKNIGQSEKEVENISQSVEEEADEDSWDAMFNDDGDCLDPTAMEELTRTVGKVKIQKTKKVNYLDYQPKDKGNFDYSGKVKIQKTKKVDYLDYQPKDNGNFDHSEYAHIIEIYDFPKEFVTRDLISAFQPFMSRGFDLKWVDDTHALGIFSSKIAAGDALDMNHPLVKVCSLSQASKQSRDKARRCTEFLQPYKPRPETSAMAARRLVAGALGLATNVSREKRDLERKQLKEAKEKRRNDRKNREDIWEFGGNCAMDEET